MYISRFSSPESTNRVAPPLALNSKSRPPRRPYSTLLSVSLKVVQVTLMEPGTPGSERKYSGHYLTCRSLTSITCSSASLIGVNGTASRHNTS
ncbi:hypothetical protein EYF80_002462 [Liparis tanakae]|uniref:Uncharacterized protein n=1 Tax=Liparis tanakae TaxID=230148 RepID=A0A4Z2JAY1_9TELE|nr:hypothetical protein EYF80_002462 [Liparis tanakae]